MCFNGTRIWGGETLARTTGVLDSRFIAHTHSVTDSVSDTAMHAGQAVLTSVNS